MKLFILKGLFIIVLFVPLLLRSQHNHHINSELTEELEDFFRENFRNKFLEKYRIFWNGSDDAFEAIISELSKIQNKEEHKLWHKAEEMVHLHEMTKTKYGNDLDRQLLQELNNLYKDYILLGEKEFIQKHQQNRFNRLPDGVPEEDVACTNLDFEDCDFSTWNQFEGDVDGTPFGYVNVVPTAAWGNVNNINNIVNQHSIASGGIDAAVGIPMVRPGGNCSAILGDGLGDGRRAASISKTFQVNQNNYNFYYSYAIVMQDPNHNLGEQPFFRIRMYDQNGNSIDCAELDVFAGDGNPDWDRTNGFDFVDWQSAFIPLQDYIGQNVTIEFTAGDCDLGGHVCYAYVEAECNRPVELSDTATCRGNPVTISAPEGARSYSWSNGEVTQEITVEDSGWYKVTMEGAAGAGCFTEDSIYIGYYPEPTASFNTDTSCIDASKAFIDSSWSDRNIDVWSWDFNDDDVEDSNIQNPDNIYNTAGDFDVTLMVTTINNCIDDTTISVFVSDRPTPEFSFETTCLGDSLELNNLSVAVNNTFSWRYNNNEFSNTLNSKYLFNAEGPHDIELWVENQYSCKDSVTQSVFVNPNPVADFTYTPVCFPSATVLENNSTITLGNLTSYYYKIADIDEYFQEDININLDSSGVYSVLFAVQSDSGCVDTITKNIRQFDKPIANFEFDTACYTNRTSLRSLASTKDTLDTWEWDFLNDMLIDNDSINPSFTFPDDSSSQVNLRVTTIHGCSHDTTMDVFVAPLPVPDFSVALRCLYDSVQLANTSNNDGSSFEWIFDINDYSVNSTRYNEQVLFDTAQTYTSRLIMTSPLGCVDSIQKQFIVRPVPKANFGFEEVCFPFATQFSDSSSIHSGVVMIRNWKFDDGSDTIAGENISHNYANYGTYNVELVATSDFGCKDSVQKPVEHFEKPVANFDIQEFCMYDSVTVTNNSTTIADAITEHLWTSPNGSSNRYEPKFKFNATGEKVISLQITTENNCSDTVRDTTYIHAIPLADFDFDNVCTNSLWSTDNTSSISEGIIAQQTWTIGTDSWNTLNMSTNFGTSDEYDVELIVVSDFGCRDTTTKTTIVYPLPSATFEITNKCFPEAVEFKALSNVGNLGNSQIGQNNWELGDGNTANGDEISHYYDSANNYNVKLVSVTNNGCLDSITQTATVHPKPNANFTSSNPQGCSEWCIEYTDLSSVSSGSIRRRLWNLDNGALIGDSLFRECYPNQTSVPLSFDVELFVETDKGCTDDTVQNNYVTVYPNAVADFSFQPNTIDENNGDVFFQNWSLVADDYTWNLGDSSISREFEPRNKYPEAGEYLVTLIANNEYSCPDTSIKPLIIDPVYNYFFPNTFTPNNDGINDEFYAKHNNITYIELYIYNRWGQLIYNEEGVAPSWNGNYMGNIVQIDTYVYKAILTDVFGKTHVEVGHVNVLR